MSDHTPPETDAPVLTGRCYCGRTRIEATAMPRTVTYCHCDSCRRVTGAAVAVFAAFETGAIRFHPDEGQAVRVSAGVERRFCPGCGSPLAGRYDYLSGQVYLPVGLFDQADRLRPQHHAHAGNCLTWLKLDDRLPRHPGSARAALNER